MNTIIRHIVIIAASYVALDLGAFQSQAQEVAKQLNAFPVIITDSTAVVFKQGDTIGVAIVSNMRMPPNEACDVQWFLRTDGALEFGPSAPGLTTGTIKDTNYLQSSGIFGVLAILTGTVVAIIGILILLLTKSRRAHILSVISAGLPILVGAAGSLVGYLTTRNVMHDKFASDPSVMHQWHSELASPTIVGATIALPLFVLLGFLFAFRTKHLDGKRPI